MLIPPSIPLSNFFSSFSLLPPLFSLISTLVFLPVSSFSLPSLFTSILPLPFLYVPLVLIPPSLPLPNSFSLIFFSPFLIFLISTLFSLPILRSLFPSCLPHFCFSLFFMSHLCLFPLLSLSLSNSFSLILPSSSLIFPDSYLDSPSCSFLLSSLSVYLMSASPFS